MTFVSDFVWLFSARSSRVIAGVVGGLLVLTALDGGYSAGRPAGALQLEADLKTQAARKAALERIAAFIDTGAPQIQPKETGVPARPAIMFNGHDHAFSKPAAVVATGFSLQSDITGSINSRRVKQPVPPIDTLWRLNAGPDLQR